MKYLEQMTREELLKENIELAKHNIKILQSTSRKIRDLEEDVRQRDYLINQMMPEQYRDTVDESEE